MSMLLRNWMIRGIAFSFLMVFGVFFPCSAVQAGDALRNAGVGVLGGALVGSLSGPSKNKQENALIGGAIGAALGYVLGNEAERMTSGQTVRVLETMPSYTTTQWVDPDSGVALMAEPRRATTVNGRVCREVAVEGSIDGDQETILAKACRQHDGTWRIVNRRPVPSSRVVVYEPVPQTIYYPTPPPTTVIIQSRDHDRRGHHRRDYRSYREHRRHEW